MATILVHLQILEEEATLFFHLQQQQLIELIRAGNVEEALAFAQEFLAYKGEENEALLEELGALRPACRGMHRFTAAQHRHFVATCIMCAS